jgi:RNA polymerase sigma factor (sigma-70 family)
MANGSSKVVHRQIETLFGLGRVAGMTDGQLLDRFTARRDEVSELAFAELVGRHGPMVLGVCRRALRDPHDVDDAFQATFLVLVRKAGSIARRGPLAPWLYGVASRTARGARARAAGRRAREGRVIDIERAGPRHEAVEPDLAAALDEELSRLPEKYRAPLVLCELEGKSRKEAAALIGVPEGTISSRLARGRSLLRERLVRRGLAPASGALAAVLSREASAAVPAALAGTTVRAASCFAAGPAAAGPVSASALALAEGVLKTMLLTKLKVAATALALSVVGTGVVVMAQAPSPSPSPRAEEGPRDAVAPDRLREVERKLDRILEAVGPRAAALDRPGPDEARPGSVPAAGEWARDVPSNPAEVKWSTRGRTPSAGRPASDRLSEVERRLERVELMLDEVRGRLGRLEGSRGPMERPDQPPPPPAVPRPR